jgi:beta-galactosidase
MNWQTEAAMTHKIIFLLALAAGLAARPLPAAETLPLAGEWRFALDRHDTGIGQLWFAKKLPDKIQLPGSLESQGYGDPISPTTPWVLSLYDHFWYLRADYAAYTNAGSVKVPFLCQPARHYLGAAWYQRDFEIPFELGRPARRAVARTAALEIHRLARRPGDRLGPQPVRAARI